MEVMVPFHISNCEGDCPFWEFTEDMKQMCDFSWESWKEIPTQGVPSWCPLRKHEVKSGS